MGVIGKEDDINDETFDEDECRGAPGVSPIYRRQNFLKNRRYIAFFGVKIGGKCKKTIIVLI